MQIVKPDIRVYNMVEELASGPLPSWKPRPTILILNKVCRVADFPASQSGRQSHHHNETRAEVMNAKGLNVLAPRFTLNLMRKVALIFP